MVDIRVPTYESQVTPNLPAVTPVGVSESGLTELTKNLGDIIAKRGQELIKEYDESIITTAYDKYLGQARDQMQIYISREGIDAYGVQKDYNQWHEKAADEIANQYIKNQTQGNAFRYYVERAKNSDLDALAHHEIKQHQRHKQEVIDSLASKTDDLVRKNAGHDVNRENAVNIFLERLDALYPGRELGAAKAQYMEGFRIAALEEMIDDDPERAKLYLEQWKGDLGDKYHGLKRLLEKEIKDNRIETTYHVLMTLYPNDPQEAIEQLYDESFMKRHDLDVDERDYLVRTLQGEINWAKTIADRQRDATYDEEAKMIVKQYQDGDLMAAMNIIRDSEAMDGDQKMRWLGNIIQVEKKFTDQALKNRVHQDILDGEIRLESDIRSYQRKGLADFDANQLVKVLKDQQKDPIKNKALKLANNYFDTEFGEHELFYEYKNLAFAWLYETIEKDRLKGMDIYNKFVEHVGTIKEIERTKGLFGLPIGPPTTKAPFGEQIEAEIERREGGGRLVESKPILKGPEEIPLPIRQKISDELTRQGFKHTDDNYWKVYQEYKDEF
jgi:hypothetical protein